MRKTYFLIAGIAGISPKYGSLGSVTLARYAVQVDLQYQFDGRAIPAEWKSGYVPQGCATPNEYPKIIYGTEVFEVNEELQKIALDFASRACLEDSERAQTYRRGFAQSPNGIFEPATRPPFVFAGDVASSNVFFHGHLLSETFEHSLKIMTDGKGQYTTTAQEDTATLAALVRGAVSQRLDFSRVIILRSASNFDQPPDIGSIPEIPLHLGHGGLELGLENLYGAGVEIVQGILRGWKGRFEAGVRPRNYIGDIFGSLGGEPDFGPGRCVEVAFS